MQDTVGSSIAYAAILELGATVPTKLLRCVLNTEDMVTLKTGDLDVSYVNGGIVTGSSPGLGITVNEAVLGDSVRTWGD